VSWNLKGSYFETCSCELMCPCNFSFDHGATYDYCRVTLVFNISDGEIEGTDVSGLKLAVIADTPKVMTEGNWRLGMFVDEARQTNRWRSSRRSTAGRRAARWQAWPADRRAARGRARADRGRGGGPSSQRPDRNRDRLRGRGHRPLRIETGEPVRITGMFHPVGSELTAAEATRSQISAFGIEYEGKTGLSSAFSWAA
jgi:hypothetical protein